MMDAPFPVGMVEEIEQFLKNDHERPSGQDLYREVFDTQFFFPLQRKGELAQMIRIARQINPRVVMEIGCDKGGGLYHWCKCLPTVQRVLACEVRGLPYDKIFEDAFPRLSFQWIPYSSITQAILPRVHRDHAFKPIDILFIDGDKTLMEKDFDAYLPVMNPDGIVFFHDVQDKEPRTSYWNVRARGYGGEVIVNLSDTQAALEQQVKGIPPANPHEGWLRHWRGRSCGVGVVYLAEKRGSS